MLIRPKREQTVPTSWEPEITVATDAAVGGSTRGATTAPNPQQAASVSRSVNAIDIGSMSHAYRRGEPVVSDITLRVRKGECLAIIGPSGCGKTTIMNVLAGLERPQSGEVSIEGKSPLDGRRQVGYMLARDALLAWRTSLQNVMLPLELRGGMSSAEVRAIATDRLAEVGLKSRLGSYPAELSHGMRQRVALARTLATEPSILLMDEPFSALDAQTRVILQGQFCRLTEQRGISSVLITHDLGEAIAVGDHVAVLTSRPARIKAMISVDIPRPRDVTELQEDERFHRLFEQAWSELKSEVKEASW